MTWNEDEGYDKENTEEEIVEEIVEHIYEEEDMDKDSHEDFLISDESGVKYPDSDTEA